MTLRCSKQRFFPLKTLSTEEEDSAILHVSSPVTPVTCGKQRNSQRNRPMGRLELNTKSVWGPTWYQRGQKHPSTCPEGDEHPSSSAAPWLELTAYLHISREIRNVWILFEKPWFCLCVLFNCDSCWHFGNFMLFQTPKCLKRFVFQVLKTRLARSSGSPPYAQKLLQGWVPAFQTFLVHFFRLFLCIFVHVWWSVIRRGFCAQRWFDRTRCVQRLGGNTVPEHQRVSSEVTESVPSPAKKMDIVRIVHIILHIVTFLQMWNRKILGIFLICLLRKVHKIAAESVAWFQANLPAMQNGDCQPTHWVGEENYRWTYRIYVSISPCQTFTDILSEVGPHQPCFHEIEHSESFKPFGFFFVFLDVRLCVSTYWIKSWRMDDFVALSNLLHLPTHPDVARHSDGITALLSAAWGTSCDAAMHSSNQDVTRRNWNLVDFKRISAEIETYGDI